MNSANEEQQRPDAFFRSRKFQAIAALVGAGLVGAFVSRLLIPAPHPATQRFARPIVQFVRQQPGLPSLADVVDRLCPSVATLVPHEQDSSATVQAASNTGTGATSPVPAFAVSADGWLLTSASLLPAAPFDAVFGDGRRASVSDVRTDPVSGLAIVKVAGAATQPLALSDQVFPRVGEFGFALTTPAGNGCSAKTAMIESDFLADGGGLVTYFRLQTGNGAWTGGVPFIGSDGRAMGVAAAAPEGAVIPGPLAAIIADELIRNDLSATTGFGFRAIDFAPPLSARLGVGRSGAGVALVEAKSAADTAGLKAGDIIAAVNGNPVSGASELGRALDAVPKTATLDVTRGDQQLKLTVRRSVS
ncbi:MAG TPA: S1C family serine protease [Sphingomicrobium sp.]|nr:S1C family serine protease [Sphingomicrobium sp.]